MFASRRLWQLPAIAALVAASALGQQIMVYSSGSLAIGQTRSLTAYVPLPVNTVPSR